LEDELHLVFECPVNNEIIKWYPALFNELYANVYIYILTLLI
jgi:hypothetical protein